MMFRRLRNLIIMGGLIVALVPSLTVGLGYVSFPPELEAGFAFVMGFVGLIVFFAVLVARTAFLRLGRGTQIGLFGLAAVLGLIAAGGLKLTADASIRSFIDNRSDEPKPVAYLRPDRADYSEALTWLVDGKYRGSLDAALKAEPVKTLELMAYDARSVEMKMLVLLALAQALLVTAVMLGGFAGVKAAGSHADEVIGDT